MEIPIQRDVYIWANYSVSSYLNFIPICWNVLIWLKYDFIHISMHHFSLYFETTAQIPEVEFGGKYGLWGQILIFEGKYGYLPWGQITNTDFQLLLDMQKRTYCNKICDNQDYIWFINKANFTRHKPCTLEMKVKRWLNFKNGNQNRNRFILLHTWLSKLKF
jgi:hypothetical protein